VLLSLFYFLSLSRISENSENSHHAKIVNYNAFSEFLQMVPKHNFIGPFKLFLFIGYLNIKNAKKKIRQTAGRFEPSRAQSLFDTQKSLSERYLIAFCFSRNFRSEKLFAESFGTREARKIEPWFELSFQNVYWEVIENLSSNNSKAHFQPFLQTYLCKFICLCLFF
jgi:hypothetical protein